MDKLNFAKSKQESETSEPSKSPPKQAKTLQSSRPVRIKPEVDRMLTEFVEKINSGSTGTRKIKKSRVIEFAVSLLNDSHRQQLQEETFTNTDRMEHLRKNFEAQNGPVSMELFLGKVLSGELSVAKLQKQIGKQRN